MTVGRRNVDVAGDERLTVAGMRSGQRAGARQNVGKHAASIRREVEHDDDGGLEVGIKT